MNGHFDNGLTTEAISRAAAAARALSLRRLARLNNQKPDEVVDRYLSTATAIDQQTQCVKLASDE